MKNTLYVAGTGKRANPDLPENIVMIRAMSFPKPNTRNDVPETRNPKPEDQQLKPETLKPVSGSRVSGFGISS